MNKFGKVVFMGVVIGGLLAGCGEADVQKVDNSASKQEQSQKEDKPEQKQEEKQEEQKNEFKIGETASIDGMEITINSVSFIDPVEYSEVENGKVLRLEVSAKNNASDNGFIDNIEFQVYANDEKYDFYYGHDDASIGGGELKKGKSMKLILDFDVPEADSYEIYYEPSFTFKDNAEIKYIVSKGEIK